MEASCPTTKMLLPIWSIGVMLSLDHQGMVINVINVINIIRWIPAQSELNDEMLFRT